MSQSTRGDSAMTNPSLNENWSVSLKIVVPVYLALMTSTGWITKELWRIESRQNIAWTLHDQREWARQVGDKNTNVFVPNPNDIFWMNRRLNQAPISFGQLSVSD